MTDAKVFSIQPRFKFGDQPSGWALIDGIFNLGKDLPPYGSELKDANLAWEWMKEPMTAGVFSTWVEKAQTINWKVVGGRNNANFYANLFQSADKDGWTYHEGVCAIDYLTTDKGMVEELGRGSLDEETIKLLQDYNKQVISHQNSNNLVNLDKVINSSTLGRVKSVQHLDSTRMIKIGLPSMRWRYYPEYGYPVSIPDENLIQITSMPSGRDRYRGFGLCALSRIIDAKNLMLGYLNYYRQEIGDLPPELVAIINGMSSTEFQDVLNKYKMDKKAKRLDEYGKIMWLGSDDPMTPVDMKIISLINHTKSFAYKDMVEWWMKVLALNVGEDIGEFWLLQRGESKTVQSIQAMKAKAKGVARYLQEKERKYNLKIMPFGTRFEYDNPDDEADKLRAEIVGMEIGNLAALAKIGAERQDFAYTIQEVRDLANQWEIIPPDLTNEEIPTVIGAVIKEIAGEDVWCVDSNFESYPIRPILKGKEQREAKYVFNVLKEAYFNGFNGYQQHRKLENVAL